MWAISNAHESTLAATCRNDRISIVSMFMVGGPPSNSKITLGGSHRGLVLLNDCATGHVFEILGISQNYLLTQ